MDTPITEQRWQALLPDWRNDDDVSPHPSDGYIVSTQGWQTTVATVRAEGLDWSQVEARSNLIAAAPELLAALRTELDTHGHLSGRCAVPAGADGCSARCEVVRAAVAKAEGRADAVEIQAVRGCDQRTGATCLLCLGCLTCRTYAVGCVCPPAQQSAEQRAWLASERALTDHLNLCFPCLLEWATDCERGAALRVACDEALATYKASRQGGRQ